MAIRLLALDMDGTVLQNDAVTVSQANLAAIRAAIGLGVAVTYCTGRMRHRLPQALLAGAPEIQALRSWAAWVWAAPGQAARDRAAPVRSRSRCRYPRQRPRRS